MKLNIQKPLVIFDLETTGLDFIKDRVIQLSYIKVMPDGEEKRENITINPLIPIPPFVTELTGISDADVADSPTFKEIAPQLAEEFKGCDLAGYNSNNFDIPMLCEEFLRAGIDFDFSKCRLIDAMAIFRKQERRNLAAAYKFYCGRKMEEDFEAHRADQDTEATYRVLMGQLDRYSEENFYQRLADCFLTVSEESDLLTNISSAFGIDFSDADRKQFNDYFGGE